MERIVTNEPRARKNLDALLAIPGASGSESEVLGFIVNQIKPLLPQTASLRFDEAHKKIGFGSSGNLIVTLQGDGSSARRLFMAHTDTVPLCVGSKVQERDGVLGSALPGKGIGADNRAGCAVLLETLLSLLESKLPFPPLTFVWTVQEEVGLRGSQMLSREDLGSPAFGLNFDGSTLGKVVVGAIGGKKLTITIRGKASHAGVHPERGVSAIVAAADAIAALQSDGLLGRITTPQGAGLANIGKIHGGVARNVVPESVVIEAEARSHDASFLPHLVSRIAASFARSAAALKNQDGVCAESELVEDGGYPPYRLSENESVVKLACKAYELLEQTPALVVSDGGLDASATSNLGIPTVSFGCGQRHQHTAEEELHLSEFFASCRLAGILTRLPVST